MSEETMGILRGLTTVLAMLAFIAVCVWAYSRRRQRKFDEAAQLPLEEDPS
jgi:cytochrome c oxidase cbb3-type subunit 4